MHVSALPSKFAGFLSAVLSFALGGGLFFCAARAQDTGFPIITSFSAAEIGAEARSWIAVQDADRVLHFGCDALASYDGERWRATPLDNAYALRGLDFGDDGRLWFGANGDIGWFERESGGRWQPHSLRANLPRELAALGEVWHAFAETHGAVFITEDKVLRWDGKAFRTWSMPGGRRLVAMRGAGKVYVHHVATGLYVLGANGPELVISATVLGDAMVFWMESRGTGWLLATSHGLFVFADGRLEPFAPAVSDYVRGQALTSAVRLPDGRLAVGTYRGGLLLARADGSLDRVLTEDDGLPTHAIFSLFVDRDGGLWAMSASHIFRVAADSPSTLFDQRAGLPALPVGKIARHDGRIVAATDRGVFALQPDGRHFAPVDELRERLLDLRSTGGGLLAASYRQLRLVSAGKSQTLYSSDKDPMVAQPSRRWPGTLLISTGPTIVALDSQGGARTVVRDLPDIATSIAEDGAGRIWIGTLARGILSALPDSVSAVVAVPATATRGLPAFGGAGLVVATPDDAVLAFTSVGGWRLGRGAENFQLIAGAPRRDVAVASEPAADGSVWIAYAESEGRPSCIARVAVVDDRATWQPHSVEGLPSIGAPRAIFAEASAGDHATVLWMGGTNGLLRSVAAAGPVALAPRLPLLRAFARGAEHDALQPITRALPYSTRAVLFEFAAPEFARRPALRLETRVDGVDTGWVMVGPSARRELTAMRDGTYVLRVRAVAETGAVSEAATFNFEILPPWWRTTPAILGALMALGAATLGFFRLRERALRRRNAELEEKVRVRTEQLALASAAKTQFVANMSHDIRNPLNGIVGLALALENTRLDSGQREFVATLRECTTYLSTLMDDVLDFASIETGHVELRAGPFAPSELLRSVATMLKADAAQRGATLVVEVDPDLPPALLGDAGRIQQILVNYVTNALKYAGGTIRLSAHTPSGAAGEIEFAVTDQGPGISEAEQAILFTKFTRLANGRDAQIKGAGLGLASCRLLADLMDGSVGVVSGPDRGARFFLRLPLAVCTVAPEVVGSSLPQANVLVVEDTDYNAWAAAAVLGKLGLAHTRVRSGAEALQLFSAKQFNVVLLDRNLPDMDGTEVARRIRALEPDGPRAILLAVTAYCTAEDRQFCLDAGMDAFVGKPLTPDKLRKVLLAAGRRLLSAASVHAPPDAHDPPVDLSLLGYLSDGTEEGLDAQIDRFVAALGDADEQLRRAAQASENHALADAAHLVLSQAKLIGCAALEEAAFTLERAARAQDATVPAERVAQVHREIASLTGALLHRPHATHSA